MPQHAAKIDESAQYRQFHEEDLIATATAMIPVLKARIAETDLLAKLPESTARQLQDAGLWALCLPRLYGGRQAAPLTHMRIVHEIARGDGSAAWVVALLNICTWLACTLFPKSVTDEVFTDPKVQVAGVLTPRACQVRRVAGGYVIEHGLWAFNSGAHHASWDLLGIPKVDEAGEVVDEGLALIPMAELERLDDWDTIGLRGSGSISVKATNVFVPDARVASMRQALESDYVTGRACEDELYRLSFMPMLAVLIAFPALGIGQAALDLFMEKLPGRPITYSCYPRQAEAPVTHLQVAEASAKIDAAKLVAERIVGEIMRGAADGTKLDYLVRARIRRDVGFIFRLVWEAVDLLASAGGGSLAAANHPLNRIWRDAKIAALHGIACTTSNFELFGRIFCGQPAKDPLV